VSAEAHVRRTILTLYVDGYRRRRHWAGVTHLVARGDVTDGPELSGADRVDLRAALDVLSPQERACVVLRFYEDLTVPEVASRLHLADGTVKRYLSNAVGKLELRLGPVPTHDPDDVLVTSVKHPTSRAARSTP
jgi:RNA polymerase sigma-70 factor (ECF subfamily)